MQRAIRMSEGMLALFSASYHEEVQEGKKAVCLITGNTNLDLLVKVVSVRFLYCEVIIFHFSLRCVFCGDTLRLGKYPVSCHIFSY